MMYSRYYTDAMDKADLDRIVEIGTITELLDSCMSKYSEYPAITSAGVTATYKQLLDDVALTRGFLLDSGVKSGDHIGIMLKNEYDFMRVFLATVSLGCVAALIPMQTPVTNIVPLCKGFSVNCLIHSRVFGEAFKSAGADFSVFSQDEVKGGRSAEAAKDIVRNTPAAIIFTGGTTGKSKGVLLSHGNLMRGTISGAYGTKNAWFARYLAIIPFTHVFGLVRSGLTVLYTGGHIYMCEEMRNIFKDLPAARPQYLVLVPGLAELIWGVMVTRGAEAVGGELETIISGGAAVPQKLIDKLQKFGVTVYPGYGLTETANLVSGNIDPFGKKGSVGRPYGYEELKIVDGELYIKGENVMLGYYGNPEATAAVFEDGWFKTGDLVRMDEDGDLYIVGRTKNVIILDNGENVSPESIEDSLNELPFIQDCLAYEDVNKAGAGIIAVEIFPSKKVLEAMNCDDPQALIQGAVDKFNASVPSYMRVAKVTLRDTDFERSGSMKVIRGQVKK